MSDEPDLAPRGGRLAGKIAIVTGAAGGIGSAIVERFANEGARVVATDVIAPHWHPRGAISFEYLDVADELNWRRLGEFVKKRDGGADILVNNAGIRGSTLNFLETSLEDWNNVVGINQTSVFLGIREFVPHMIARGGGAIVNISSIFGAVAVANLSAYHATKAAVRMMTRNAAATFGVQGIRVNAILPGVIDTPATVGHSERMRAERNARTALGRRGQPEEVAAAALFLASDEASYVTGAELAVDGGYMAK